MTASVAHRPITFCAALQVGIEQGCFAAEGLEVVPKPRLASSALFAVASHGCNFGFGGVPAVVAGRANGLHLRVVARAAGWPRDPNLSTLQVVVRRDSEITTPKELEWRRLAIDTFGQLGHISAMVSARKRGADPARIRFVEMPFADMPAALESGQVDAADMGEPYLSRQLEDGARVVFANSEGFPAEATQGVWVTTDEFVAREPEAVRRFRRAIERSNDLCASQPQEARRSLAASLSVPAELAPRLRMPHFGNHLERGVFSQYRDALRGLGLISADVDLDALFLD
ncbi:MAG: ABC transporter substrate-binding protein [Candidatus Dormiibacterota bacterium]